MSDLSGDDWNGIDGDAAALLFISK